MLSVYGLLKPDVKYLEPTNTAIEGHLTVHAHLASTDEF